MRIPILLTAKYKLLMKLWGMHKFVSGFLTDKDSISLIKRAVVRPKVYGK